VQATVRRTAGGCKALREERGAVAAGARLARDARAKPRRERKTPVIMEAPAMR
jgi:hypothetical protein